MTIRSRRYRLPLVPLGYLAFAVFVVFPLFWIATMSIKTFGDIIAVPPRFIFSPTFDNFREVLSTGFPRYLLNSMIISGGAVALALVVGLPAAYVLARGKIRGREHIAFTFLSFRFAPEFAVVLPLFALYQRSGLYDTYWGLIIAHQLLTLPLVIWICRGFIEDIPYSMEEAARVDGAGPWNRLFHVVIPIIRPGIAAALIIAFITSWNNLLLALVLSGRNTTPVTMGILEAITFDQIRWGEMAASALIAALPGVLIAIYLQRHLVRGLTMGAVKQ
jgi:multiple sugar transport system permease protein